MRCPNCNSQLPEGRRFCGHCGYRLVPREPRPPTSPPDELDEDASTSPMPGHAFDDDAPTSLTPPEQDEAPSGDAPVPEEPSSPAVMAWSNIPATRSPPAPVSLVFLRRLALLSLTICLALVTIAFLVPLIGSFVLSLAAERAIATADWGLQTANPGVYILSEVELNEGLRAAVEPYALEPVEDLRVDLRSPDTAVLELTLFSRPVSLEARFETREGIPAVGLERLNDVPLPIVGGIVSWGINRGFESVWEDSPLSITSITFESTRVIIHMERN